jgi:hypothetical protein
VIKFQPNGQASAPYVIVQTTPGNTVRIIWPTNLPEARAATMPMPRP